MQRVAKREECHSCDFKIGFDTRLPLAESDGLSLLLITCVIQACMFISPLEFHSLLNVKHPNGAQTLGPLRREDKGDRRIAVHACSFAAL